MSHPILLTPEERALVADGQFFAAKARIMRKVRGLLDELHVGLTADLAGLELVAPERFDPATFQFVKGEHLADCPYQYLDCPKHFSGDDKFAFRSLFWWGHPFVFAWILEGSRLRRYKENLINRYHQVADRQLELGLSPTPWEWRQGEGYTLPLTRDRKPEVAAVLSQRRFFKLARFVPLDHPAVQDGSLAAQGRETFRACLPVVTP
ncbi:MAG: hypothetical protein FJ246_12185 [Nitrospira sp.]|nr:hypothetical protein [Nitrospira sp.]